MYCLQKRIEKFPLFVILVRDIDGKKLYTFGIYEPLCPLEKLTCTCKKRSSFKNSALRYHVTVVAFTSRHCQEEEKYQHNSA